MKILIIVTLSMGLTLANEAALQEFKTGNNLFTAAIYKEVLKENEGNFLISPFSIQTVLALTQSGAKDDTASEIRKSVSLPENTEAVYSAILPTLRGNEQYKLHTANKIYVKNNYELNDSFRNLARDVYQAGVENVEFSQKFETSDIINKWVAEQTENKIQNMIDPQMLDDDTRVILINSLYFKGKWQTPFETYSTRKRDFFKTAKEVAQVDTMHMTEVYNYYESPELNAKFLELPYKGDDVSMVVVLPNEVEGLRVLESQIERVFEAPKFSKERVSVSFPKFTIENKLKLKKLLQNLGVNKLFTEDADLSGIAGRKGELVVSDVLQKAFINVTESGTEATAATAASAVVTLSLPPQYENKKSFKADHPFLFYVKFRTSNVVLFVVQGVRIASSNYVEPKFFHVDRPFIYYIITKNVVLFVGRVTLPNFK